MKQRQAVRVYYLTEEQRKKRCSVLKAAYYRRNRKKRIAASRAYYARSAYYARNAEKLKAAATAYFASHRKAVNKRRRILTYHKKNRRKNRCIWVSKNREKIKSYGQKRYKNKKQTANLFQMMLVVKKNKI
jgi:hypothetical protein